MFDDGKIIMTHTYRAHAKINLLLDITGKLPNGYHSIATIMQSISLHDTLEITQTGKPGIEITCDVPGIPTDERNIVHKACKAFGFTGGLRIDIQKRIPSEAGLAGGSANAAAVLAALRDIYAPEMPLKNLLDIAVRVGADVPFCLVGGCCLAEGVGEALTPLPCLPGEYRIALVKPAFSVSTAQAYAALDNMTFTRPQTELAIAHAKQGDWEQVFPLCENVFEQAIGFASLNRVKQNAFTAGAKLVQMTGSGSAVFAVFESEKTPGAITRALGELGEVLGVFEPVAYGINKGG
jgi:4-diphosphocytidyl-2-C-methyl-D-erythritol kinase